VIKTITCCGKKVCNEKSFILYTMRHTFATCLYEYTRDMKKVAKRLGHKKSDTVDKYVHIADSMKEQTGKRNLFNQALRSMKKIERKANL
jgi:site-specific recombinase XerD